jgi:propionyl-CoA synthetase
MLACARIGAIHSVVFGGFAAASLATRIDDARRGRWSPPMPACAAARRFRTSTSSTRRCGSREHPPRQVSSSIAASIARCARHAAATRLRGSCARAHRRAGAVRMARIVRAVVHPLHVRHHRQAEGRAARHRRLRGRARVVDARDLLRRAGRDDVLPRDIGWVVGHSYIVYAPLINGSTTIMYEGCRSARIPAIWWKIVAEHGVKTMFSSPTAIRVLKKQDPSLHEAHDRRRCKYLFLAGEPLDEPTARWARDALGVAIVDNYWQTETGWPILSAQPASRTRRASSARRRFRCTATTCAAATRRPAGSGIDEKGVLTIAPPLPPAA